MRKWYVESNYPTPTFKSLEKTKLFCRTRMYNEIKERKSVLLFCADIDNYHLFTAWVAFYCNGEIKFAHKKGEQPSVSNL